MTQQSSYRARRVGRRILIAASAAATAGVLATGWAIAQDAPEPAAQDSAQSVQAARAEGFDTFGSEHVVDGTSAAALPRAQKAPATGPQAKAVTDYLGITTEPEDNEARIAEVAVGAAAQQADNTSEEFRREGWRLSGSPRVVGTPSAAPVSIDGKPGQRISVCLDDTTVRVLGERDHEVRSGREGHRAMHSFDLVETEPGTWKVVATGFPDDPHC